MRLQLLRHLAVVADLSAVRSRARQSALVARPPANQHHARQHHAVEGRRRLTNNLGEKVVPHLDVEAVAVGIPLDGVHVAARLHPRIVLLGGHARCG